MNQPRNIEVGTATIEWARASQPKFGPYAGVRLEAGWVLPGGTRTQDAPLATRVAKYINDRSSPLPRRNQEIIA